MRAYELFESFAKGDLVTYELNPKIRNSPRGKAEFLQMSTTKKNHAYIKTETQGQILVPLDELEPAGKVAESNLVETSDLSIISTNDETEAVIKLIMQVMKSKGYKSKRYNQSAMFEIEFQGSGPTVTLDGWHGKGKYGSGMALFNVYVNDKLAVAMAIEPDDLNSTSRGEYWVSEEKKQAYLDSLRRVTQMFKSGSIFN